MGDGAASRLRYHLRQGRPQRGVEDRMEIVTIQPIVALIAGVLILVIPRLLNIIVALYLIFIGITGLFPHLLDRIASGG